MLVTELINAFNHPLVHLLSHTWVNANPEGVGHNEVGILEVAYLTIAFTRLAHLIECRVLDEVAGKEVTCLNLALFLKVLGELITSEICILFNGNEEATP